MDGMDGWNTGGLCFHVIAGDILGQSGMPYAITAMTRWNEGL
jgi:hypothetical protein